MAGYREKENGKVGKKKDLGKKGIGMVGMTEAGFGMKYLVENSMTISVLMFLEEGWQG